MEPKPVLYGQGAGICPCGMPFAVCPTDDSHGVGRGHCSCVHLPGNSEDWRQRYLAGEAMSADVTVQLSAP